MIFSMEKLYILLPVHNRFAITQAFINRLQRQSFRDYHLVLIDDGSDDGTARMVQSKISNLSIVTGEGDWWWGGSLHQGYLWLKKQNFTHNPSILIMNDDVGFASDFLETGMQSIQKMPDSLLMAEYQQQGKVGRGTKIDWLKFKFHPIQNQETPDCFCTNALFLQWHTFKKIGGFYPDLLPHYISDYEFTYRAKRKGIRLCTNPQLTVQWDNENTGHHKLQSFVEPSFHQSIHKFFSKKSAHNPITFSVFIWLVCPWYLKLLNWTIVWSKATVKILWIFWQTRSFNRKISPNSITKS